MSEPSTDEREALPCHQGVRGCEVVTEHYHPDEKYALAVRPAVDVEAIARMIFAHEESTSVGDEMHCNGCGEVIDGGDLNLDQARHQAAAVVAYLAGESRG